MIIVLTVVLLALIVLNIACYLYIRQEKKHIARIEQTISKTLRDLQDGE
jgi:hypothetical protein